MAPPVLGASVVASFGGLGVAGEGEWRLRWVVGVLNGTDEN